MSDDQSDLSQGGVALARPIQATEPGLYPPGDRLRELKIAERHLELVNDPAQYRLIDEAHSLPKRRVGGLPKDEARLFFGSQATRLLNQDKSRLDRQEKQIIDARKQNMRTAARLYEARQRQALGLEPAPGKNRGQGMEM